MRGTQAAGENIRAFAAARGISERSARNYRAENRPEWQAWQAARAAASDTEGGAAAPDEPVLVQRAKHAETEAWRLLTSLEAQVAANSSRAGELATAIATARKNWEAAVKNLRELQAQAGLLVPVAAVRAVQQTAIARLGQCWKAWPNKVAGDLLPEARPAFFEAARKNSRDWDDAIRSLDTELEKLLTC